MRSVLDFISESIIGTFGNLIDLGGPELRVPLLNALFRSPALEYVTRHVPFRIVKRGGRKEIQ